MRVRGYTTKTGRRVNSYTRTPGVASAGRLTRALLHGKLRSFGGAAPKRKGVSLGFLRHSPSRGVGVTPPVATRRRRRYSYGPEIVNPRADIGRVRASIAERERAFAELEHAGRVRRGERY